MFHCFWSRFLRVVLIVVVVACSSKALKVTAKVAHVDVNWDPNSLYIRLLITSVNKQTIYSSIVRKQQILHVNRLHDTHLPTSSVYNVMQITHLMLLGRLWPFQAASQAQRYVAAAPAAQTTFRQRWTFLLEPCANTPHISCEDTLCLCAEMPQWYWNLVSFMYYSEWIRGKVKVVSYSTGAKEFSSLFRSWALRQSAINRPAGCPKARNCRLSFAASLLFDQHQILLLGDRDTWLQTTCRESLHSHDPTGSTNLTIKLQAQCKWLTGKTRLWNDL